MAEEFDYMGRILDGKCIFEYFYTKTDCAKDCITLQEKETIAYKWISEQEFADFVNSDKIGKNQGRKYREFLESCLWR